MTGSLVSHADLFKWQAPGDLLARTERLRGQLGDLTLRRPGKDFREAYVASRFASWRNAFLVRLFEPDQTLPTPDFGIRLSTKELWFETTEADRPGRMRGNEPQGSKDTIERIPDDHWVEPQEYHALVRQRVQAKLRKPYAKCDGLIIWSNAFPVADEDELTFDWWRSAVAEAQYKFAEIWVHHREKFVQMC